MAGTTPPAARPTVAQYVQRALAAIDWSKDSALLYLRGIGDETDWATKMGPEMAKRLNRTDVSLSEVPYANVNTPGAGSASGEAVLTEVLAELRRRKPQMRVFLAGLSLGAWSIGDTLADNPGLRQGIAGAALIAHTNMAKAHYRMDAGLIREFNLPGDNFSRPINGPREKVLAAVDALYDGIKPLTLLKHLPTMLRNPQVFWQFYKFSIHKPTAHDNNGPYQDAAFGWLNTLIGPPRP
ncbi:MAG: hypothetical protein JWL76_299 [Thermoleophilia bacterium]|nr:hypothetical protein [Thermoleophilia bacterium]